MAAVLPKGKGSKMWVSELIQAKRWFLISLAAAIAIPSLTLVTLSQFADEMSEEEALQVATVAVKNYVDENPPRKGWKATDIYVGEKKNVIVDVHVSRYDHAQVITQRNKRIQYSYLKLACPPSDAWVYDWLDGDDRIWVNLHHHGETILKAPCPNSDQSRFLS